MDEPSASLDFGNRLRVMETVGKLAQEGYAVIQWDVDSLDWKDLSAQDIAMRVINRARQGSIILCHNNALHTAEALPVILSTLKNSGYTFVPVGELIWRGGSVDASGRQQPPHGAGQ